MNNGLSNGLDLSFDLNHHHQNHHLLSALGANSTSTSTQTTGLINVTTGSCQTPQQEEENRTDSTMGILNLTVNEKHVPDCGQVLATTPTTALPTAGNKPGENGKNNGGVGDSVTSDDDTADWTKTNLLKNKMGYIVNLPQPATPTTASAAAAANYKSIIINRINDPATGTVAPAASSANSFVISTRKFTMAAEESKKIFAQLNNFNFKSNNNTLTPVKPNENPVTHSEFNNMATMTTIPGEEMRLLQPPPPPLPLSPPPPAPQSSWKNSTDCGETSDVNPATGTSGVTMDGKSQTEPTNDPKIPEENTAAWDDLDLDVEDFQEHMSSLRHRVRRMQVQYTHENFTQQMKMFVDHQQRLNGVECQREDAEYIEFINKSEELLQRDINRNAKILPIDLSNQHPCCSSEFPSVKPVTSSLPNTNVVVNHRPINQITKATSPFSLATTLVPGTTTSDCKATPIQPVPKGRPNLSIGVPASSPGIDQNLSAKKPGARHQLSADNHKKIVDTIDCLRYNLRHVQTKYDSDVTESSSGGESCDELDDEADGGLILDPTTYLPICSSFAMKTAATNGAPSSATTSTDKYTPIRNRSLWKRCKARSDLAFRWAWVEANIHDLSTRLRQHRHLYSRLRTLKGPINFGESGDSPAIRKFPSSSSLGSVSSSNIASQASISSTNNSPIKNGPTTIDAGPSINRGTEQAQDQPTTEDVQKIGKSPQRLLDEEFLSPGEEDSSQCMRTIPFLSMKRRKLLNAPKLLGATGHESLKYSSVPCSCNVYGPDVPRCLNCAYNRLHSIDTDFMPVKRRAAFLDPTCHPTLCPPNGVSLDLYVSGLLKHEAFSNKPTVIRNNRKRKKVTAVSSEAKARKKAASAVIAPAAASTPKPKKKPKLLKNINAKRGRPSLECVKKIRDQLSSGCSSRGNSPIPSSLSDASSSGVGVTTPVPHIGQSNRRRRSEQHAFDINNIVIPYSIAAATRVERLQYKEIITPRWRIVEDYKIPAPKTELIAPETETKQEVKDDDDDDFEDMSDAAFLARHAQCEEMERQRVMAIISGNNPRKGSRVRFENKPELGDQNSQDSCQSKNKSTSTSKGKGGKNEQQLQRKRPLSLTKSFSREDLTYEEAIAPVVQPYELRQFPLPQSIYQKMLQESEEQQREMEERERMRKEAQDQNQKRHKRNRRRLRSSESSTTKSVVEETGGKSVTASTSAMGYHDEDGDDEDDNDDDEDEIDDDHPVRPTKSKAAPTDDPEWHPPIKKID